MKSMDTLEETGSCRSPSHATDDNKDARRTLRIGIVGCGRVAAYHLGFISKVSGASIVGMADKDEAAARRLANSHNVREVYSSLQEMLEQSRPDIVHILTPPFLHYSQASTALERGVHVLVEKPVTLRASETDELYRLAADRGVSLCADFIQLFHPAFLKARAIVESSRIGRVVYVESYLSQILDMPELREARTLHWSYQLPGGVLHNYLTHPLYLALHFLGDLRKITVTPKALGALPQGLTDHLDVSLDTDGGSAHVVVSHAMRSQPTYFVNVFCEKGAVSVNFDTSTVLVTRSGMMPRSLDRATSNFRQAAQLSGSGLKNIFDFLRGRLVPYQGLQELIPRFYESVRNGSSAPVSQELTQRVVRAEEQIFSQAGKLHLDLTPRPSRQINHKGSDLVLVTGAAGYVGRMVVRHLVQEGYAVRAMVRPLSNIGPLEELGVEVVFGDVRDMYSVESAVNGANIVVHIAAGLRGSPEHILESCIAGTQNVAEAARRAGVRRVIYMSSMSIYDFTKLKDGDVITEQSPLDDRPERRGAYSWGKRKAEDVALAGLQDSSTPWTILRPSVIVGHRDDRFGPVGFTAGGLVVSMSSPKRNLRLVHIEDVAAAVVRLVQNDATKGKVFVLSGPERIRVSDYLDACLGESDPQRKARVLYVPYWFAKLCAAGLSALRTVTGKGPNMNAARLASIYRDAVVDASPLKEAVGWAPPAGLLKRLRVKSNVP